MPVWVSSAAWEPRNIRLRFMTRILLFVAGALLWIIGIQQAHAQAFDLEEDDHICIIGNALADRMQHDGWLETYFQLAYPEHRLVFRDLGFAGDRINHRPRSHPGFGSPDAHLERCGADVIFAFFGYNESFDDNPEQFRKDLNEWIDHTLARKYNGESAPRIVLFSPIKHEDLKDPNLPNGVENNRRLAAYTQVMSEVAAERGIPFVNLFAFTEALYEVSDVPMTINGVHLTPEGNRAIAHYIVEYLTGRTPTADEATLEWVREAVLDKNWHWHNRYRATSGNDIWGSRSTLHNNFLNLQHELAMIDIMTANRDRRIWARAQGEDIEVVDANVPPPIEVETNFFSTIGWMLDRVEYLGGVEAIEKMTVADGLEVNLFASEEMFPELVNPVQLQVDAKGRIWVAVWATYPKWEPLKEMNDRLLILTDTDGDGVADEAKTFAYIHNPTGFEFWGGGVIVASAPNLWFLKDTDGDDVADVMIPILSGLDSADTHHAANNLIYGPDGYIYYQRGVFHLHNIETPWGPPHESETPGLYRFNPRTFEFEFVAFNQPNPHGIAFDRWGYQIITDATTGTTLQVLPNASGDGFATRQLFPTVVRPVAANGILSSLHLPERFQNSLLLYNTIDYQGVKTFNLSYEDGLITATVGEDLLYSSDPNFRPTSGVIGPDGALYIADWHNPTVGHMQHNLRDPIRDHQHGRIYRITAKDRPLQEPVSIHGEPIEHLLDLLTHPVDSVRHRVRVELSGRDTAEVIAAALEWIKQFDANDPDGAHALLEALWLHQQHNVVNRELLARLLNSPVEHARHAAARVEMAWRNRPTDDLIAGERPHIVFITGDEEYRSEESMPMLARILANRYNFKVTVLYATTDGIIDPNRLDHIGGLEVLRDADMMVMFTRFRALPDAQLQYIREFAESGKPMAGFRTATHAFLYGADHPNHFMDNEWPYQVFGQRWISHHGAESSTDVFIVSGQEAHPILRGVEPFHARSWLYHTDPLHPNATPLMYGRAVQGAAPGGNYFGDPHPVAWTHFYEGEHGTSRVFFTTLGHPHDFFNESLRRLAIQGIFWALGLEDRIPEEGLNVDYIGDYTPNNSGFGMAYKQNVRPEDVPIYVFVPPPEAVVNVDRWSGQAPLEVTFSAADVATDGALGIERYVWDFGDGNTGVGETVTHVYTENGVYQATLTVVSTSGTTSTSKPVTIVVGNTAPEPVIENPLAGALYEIRQNVALVGRALDAEDGELAGDALKWQVVAEWTDGGTIQRDVVFEGVGAEASFAMGIDWHDDMVYQVHLSAVDSAGLANTVTRTVRFTRLQVQAADRMGNFRLMETDDVDGGLHAVTADSGAYMVWNEVNLTGRPVLFVQAKSDAGALLELRSGGLDGRVLAIASVPPGGGWGIVPFALSDAAGVHDLYLVVNRIERGEVAINWVQAVGSGPGR